ncbi:MAG TPA: amino acid adenylation domain-containing protein [Chloroflexia bacterium]|nr:amino acid adenylation domain-containing protein [Chloroflexia bacterium]
MNRDTSPTPTAELTLEQKRALLAQQLAKRQKPRAFSTSFAQQRLWLVDQLEPGNAFYNVPIATRLTGPLDVATLERSLAEVVRRHDDLRTTFSVVEGQPMQVVASMVKVPLQGVDLRHLPEEAREAEAKRITEEEARRPFDLVQGPLIRTILLRTGEEEHLLMLTMHHIVSDGWSMQIFYEELEALYNAFTEGKPSPLPELPVQYADYAVWQRNWLQGDVLQAQLDYWKKQLEGAPPLLELPTDRPRPPAQTFKGDHESIVLPTSLAQQLEALGRREGATLFMTLLAAFGTLLHRYTGQADIVIGSPIAGRTHEELEGLIGFFVNTLVLRSNFAGDPTFRELLKRVRETALGAYAHQDVPFEKLVEELQPGRDMSRTPFFQVMFVLQNAPIPDPKLKGLQAKTFIVDSGTAKFDLTLDMQNEEDGLHGDLEYNTDLYDASTIRRMLGHFQTLLEGIVSDPTLRVSELPLLSGDERQQLLVEWNSTYREYPHDRCIHQLFEEQVEKTPDAVAVVFGDEQLTCGELNSRANKLARHLRKLGVGPEVLVGLCVERSIEMVVGLLGILKAGGAYVPLDPSYPKDRLAHILEDSRAPVLVTQSTLSLASELSHKVQTVYLDRDWTAIEGESGENLDQQGISVTPDNMAYAIYTSGSTGLPKGVLGLHRGAINRFRWMWETYPFTEGEVCCQKTALSFVDSIWEIFGPLLQSVSLAIIPDEVLKDPQLFVGALAKAGVTRLVLVPSLLRVLLETDHDLDAKLPRLKVWATSGEALSTDLAHRFKMMLPGRTLLNIYGSSEVSADVTWHDLSRESADLTRVPIGRPIANTQVYLLDRQMQPVPIGVPGEVYVGGANMARGYVGKPELTAERFVPNPFGSAEFGVRSAELDEGRRTKDEYSEGRGQKAEGSNHTPHSTLHTPHLEGRLYKMGDLARYLPDGSIEYLGRADYQTKIHGFRIEPDEIAATLAQHDAVRECVVIVREDEPGDRRLVAYTVLGEPGSATVGDLRLFLRQKLPDYMVPSSFVFLDALPLTPSGKVDRRALPAPGQEAVEEDSGYVAPRDAIEEVLADMWAEMLRLERVGVYSNFFDLRGHSLLAMQLVSRVRDAFRVELPLRKMFEDPTVAGMAAALVAQEPKPGRTLKAAQILQQLEGMSEAEVLSTLREQQAKRGAP